MELCKRQDIVYIRDYMDKYEMKSHMLYKNLNTFEKVYSVYLYNHHLRRKQVNRRGRASGWIYTSDSSIAKILGLDKREYTGLLKEYGATYVHGFGLCFNTDKECRSFIDMLYKRKLPIAI